MIVFADDQGTLDVNYCEMPKRFKSSIRWDQIGIRNDNSLTSQSTRSFNLTRPENVSGFLSQFVIAVGLFNDFDRQGEF